MIKPDVIDEKSKGGIIIAPKTREQEAQAQIKGTVIAIGDQCWRDMGDGAAWAKVGDRVLFAKYAGMRVPLDEQEKDYLLIINDEDITAVITEEDSE